MKISKAKYLFFGSLVVGGLFCAACNASDSTQQEKKMPDNTNSENFINNSRIQKDERPIAATESDLALMKAARKGHTEVVKTLLENGANINAQDEDGETALIVAAQNGHTETVKILLENGADVNIIATYASYYRNLSTADLRAKDYDGNTALAKAAHRGAVEIVKMLLDAGAKVNIKDEFGTPLTQAAENDHIEIVKILLENGATVDLMALVKVKNEEILELLVSKIEKVDARNEQGNTALKLAVKHYNATVAKLLLENGADVNTRNDLGWTMLMEAADNTDTKTVKVLLVAGADVNAKDKHGYTALMRAVYTLYPETEIVKLLLDTGTDVNAESTWGETALQLAKEKNIPEIIDLLKSVGAKE